MSEHVEKANEFKTKFMDLLTEYEVGVWGTMHFRIGDQELLLDTTGQQCVPPETPTEGEDEPTG